MDDPGVHLSTDDVMAEVLARVRRRVCGDTGGGPNADDLTPGDIDAAATFLQRALERRDHLVLSKLVSDDDDWRLQTSVRFRSHRRMLGPLVNAVKRGVLLRTMRWLFEFNRDNFVRQQDVNLRLLACIEALTLEVVRLRGELARARETPGPR